MTSGRYLEQTAAPWKRMVWHRAASILIVPRARRRPFPTPPLPPPVKSIVVAGLAKLNLIHAMGSWTADNVEKGIQDLLICVEMLIIAIAHTSAFPSSPYEDGATLRDGASLLEAHFAHHSAIRDFNEVRAYVGHWPRTRPPSKLTPLPPSRRPGRSSGRDGVVCSKTAASPHLVEFRHVMAPAGVGP